MRLALAIVTTALVALVLIVVTIGALVYAGNRVHFSDAPTPRGPVLSGRQKAIRDAARPCPRGLASSVYLRPERVGVDRAQTDYDVTIQCAGSPR